MARFHTLANGFDTESASQAIDKRIVLGNKLLNRPIANQSGLDDLKHDFGRWSSYNESLLQKIFEDQSIVDEYCMTGPVIVLPHRSIRLYVEEKQKHISASINNLVSIRERLELYEGATNQAVNAEQKEKELPNRKVFVVHGHDKGKRLAVEKFLEKLKLMPIVLQDQPGGSKALIEELVKHGDVAAALVIYTPDDEGRLAQGNHDLESRARENVVLELGYFIGRIGRDNVFVLLAHGIDLPSDFKGVRYTLIDDTDGWQMTTARNLKDSGLDIDVNDLL